MRIGVRLHDVNAALAAPMQTLEERAKTAAEEGFCCVQLAPAKVLKDLPADLSALDEGLAGYMGGVLRAHGLEVAVLGCYLNLAHPDGDALSRITETYRAHLRMAPLLGAAVVGTETGTPNADYAPDERSHTKESLELFIRRLAPVVECAEHYGVCVAIEPVWTHIVCDTERTLYVLKAVASPNLRVIFDPINLLCAENIEERDRVLGEAAEKLADHIAVLHLKDYVRTADGIRSAAIGTGEMDYTELFRFLKARKPYLYATLEETTNENAAASRAYIERLAEAV